MIHDVFAGLPRGGVQRLTPATTALLLISLALTALIALPIYNLLLHPLRKFPGSLLNRATRIPYSRMMISGQNHKLLLALHQRYGPIVRISPDELSVMGESVWDELMGHHRSKSGHRPGAGEHGKDPAIYSTAPNSILGADREAHARLRRSLAHGFSAHSIAEQQPLITRYVDLLLRRLREKAEGGAAALDMTEWYNWTTFDVIGDLAFGESFGCLESSEYHPWVSLVFERVRGNCINIVARKWGPLLFSIVRRLLTTKESRLKFASYLEITKEKVNKRLNFTEPRPDLIQPMLTRPGDQKFTMDQLLQTSSTLIIAGSETTATTLSAATYLLARHPEVLSKLTEEIRSSFQSEDDISLLSVNRLSYMLAVLNETLRIYPSVPPAIPRVIDSEGDFIAGHWIPGGTKVGISQYALYHNPAYFALPESFIPERWLDDPRFKDDLKKAFQPFSFGPRNCIGRNLAYAEMRLILARVIWNFDMALDAESLNWMDESETFFLWSKPPLKVHLTPRVKA